MLTRDTEWLLRDKYRGTPTPAFLEDVERLKVGEPLAYIIGWTPFLDTRIYLDSRPLIPRVETEWWVEKIVAAVPTDAHLNILDLFAGSGCIGTALLKRLPNAHCTFAELNETHLPTIQKNIATNNISADRTSVVMSNIFSHIGDTYDLIVANPPYIPLEQKESALPELSFEPPEALYAKQHGLELIYQFLTDAPKHLREGGTIYMEFNEGQETDILRHCATLPLTPTVHQDQYGRMRLLVAQYTNDTDSSL